MEPLRWHDRPRLRRPVMIVAFEGWADAGDAASDAVSWLTTAWDTQPFAGIDPEDFFDFSQTRPTVRLDEELNRIIDWPNTVLSAGAVPGTDRDVILLQGHEPQLRWRTFGEQIVEVATSMDVELVISLGALLADVPHTRPVRITGTTADADLMVAHAITRSRYQGPTGIMSVLANALGEKGIPSMALWAAVPHYVSNNPSPKAALALIRRMAEVIGATVETGDLEIAAAAYERQVDEVVSSDDDVSSYVRRLELADDEPDDEDEESLFSSTPPDPASLIADVEQFLREQGRD